MRRKVLSKTHISVECIRILKQVLQYLDLLDFIQIKPNSVVLKKIVVILTDNINNAEKYHLHIALIFLFIWICFRIMLIKQFY